MGLPGPRTRHAGQRPDGPALPPPRPAGRRRGGAPGRAPGRRAKVPGRCRHDHRAGLLRGHRQALRRGVRRRAGALRRHAGRARRPPRAAPQPGGPGLAPGQGPRPALRRAAGARLRGQRDRAAGPQPPRRDPARDGQPLAPRRQGALQGAVPGDLAHVASAPGHRGDRREDRLGVRTRLLRAARSPRDGHRRGRRRPHRHRPGRAAHGHPRFVDGLRRAAASRLKRSPPTTPAAS